jgi:hypothetical protein
MENFGSHAHAVRERPGTYGHNHELLKIDRIISMRAAVDDVHHGQGQHAGSDPSHVTPERQSDCVRRRLRTGEADAENGVSPKPALVVAAIDLTNKAVGCDLVESITAAQCLGDFAVHGCNRVQDALPTIPALVAVP